MRLPAGNIATSILSTLFLVAAPLLVVGCPSPKARFDEFVNRTPVDMTPGPDLATTSSIFDVSGTFLLSVSTTIAPSLPLQFICTNKLTPNTDGTALLEISAHPLHKDTRQKSTSTMPIVVSTMVAANGSFVVDFGSRDVPGDANPITGSDITATLKLLGSIRSADRMCGDITGVVTKPLNNYDLVGSVWGAIRVPDGTIGSALPAPDYSCGPAMTSDGGADDGGLSDGSAD